MQRELYPFAAVEDSLERHLADHSVRGRAIYLAIVALVVGALAALPLVRVQVSVRSPGIIRPLTEKHEVTARIAGFAETLAVRDGARVERGQELLTLRAADLGERIRVLEGRITALRSSVHDLGLLTGPGGPEGAAGAAFRSAEHRQELAHFGDEMGEVAARVEQVRREAERARALAARGVVPVAEAESRELHLAQLRSEHAARRERYRSGWQSALAAAGLELDELLGRRGMLEEEKALYRVASPVRGTVEQLAGISPGSFVQAGQRLAVISPLTDLVAEVYVAPRDVGLLRRGLPARVLVDAFPYADWGFVTGRVSDIADDFVLVRDQPVFRVGVTLAGTELRLPNGVAGRLRKGMTVQARFMVAERTLFQLLRDDVNDWLDPARAG